MVELLLPFAESWPKQPLVTQLNTTARLQTGCLAKSLVITVVLISPKM